MASSTIGSPSMGQMTTMDDSSLQGPAPCAENKTRTTGRVAGRKRSHHGSLDSGEVDEDGGSAKRLLAQPPEEDLCRDCSRIPWSSIEEWLNFEGRFTWVGKEIANVGYRYRNVSPSAPCPLCRQLWAPWIEDFLQERYPNSYDLGDSLHIFRHLRHMPQVNDFPTSVQVMKKHHAPFHIAVVPIQRGWKTELKQHFATRGMVVVIPPGQKKRAIFNPRQISPAFDSQMVHPWMRLCGNHKDLCRPKPPRVENLKLIDCDSDRLVIRDYCHDDRYVALSYVWGKPLMVGAKVDEEEKRGKQADAAKATVLGTRPSSSFNYNTRKRKPKRSKWSRASLPAPSSAVLDLNDREDPRPRLPKHLPLTVRDAIQVTRDMGYHLLWIDKYCIDQNDEQTKQAQITRMGDIYGGAQLTIFALGRDANYGLPGVSSRLRQWQQQITAVGAYQMHSTMPDPHFCIKNSKWATRGWTYQEGIFSPRRLFFTDHQVYFECNAMNATESLETNFNVLHTHDRQRFRAYHRAGRFICGNSNRWSHVKVTQSHANHRKIDMIRRCQFQIRQYTKTELTHDGDVLDAFAGVAGYFAKTSAKIACLAGIPVPFPLARLGTMRQEGLDHLSYALAWTHRLSCFDGGKGGVGISTRKFPRWTPNGNPYPYRRTNFPSWSWAGWFGELGWRSDLVHCWTSLLSNVRIGFNDGTEEDLAWLLRYVPASPNLVQRFLSAQTLYVDAFVLIPEQIKFWEEVAEEPGQWAQSSSIKVRLSAGAVSFDELHRKVMDRTYECLVLGTYGEPRREVIHALRSADIKSAKAKKRRIDLFERVDPDAIICLVVHTVNGESYRVGLIKVELDGISRERCLRAWVSKVRRGFSLV